MMTSLFLPFLLPRKYKSAIINVCAGFAYAEGLAGNALYAASKAYNRYLSCGIAMEL